MKLNIADPTSGIQKVIEVESEEILRALYDKTISSEIEGSKIGEEFNNFILKITGGQDKQGFAMKQGVLTTRRVKILLSKGTTGCRGFQMKKGEKKRKSVRGCIVSPEIRTLNLVIVKSIMSKTPTGELSKKIEGKRRSSKIRKIFSINKEDDLRKYVIRENEEKPKKITRFITPELLQRKRKILMVKNRRFNNAKQKMVDFSKQLNNNGSFSGRIFS